MEQKIRRYADLFGGTLAHIVEFGNMDGIQSTNLVKAIKYLDLLMKSKFELKKMEKHNEIIEWLNSDVIDKLHEKDKWLFKSQFEKLCKGGFWKLAKIRFDAGCLKKKYISEGFIDVCSNGNLEFAKHIAEKCKIYDVITAFIRSCTDKTLYVAKWLYEKFPDNDFKESLLCYDDYATACELTLIVDNGEFETTKWLYKLGIKLPQKEILAGAVNSGNLLFAEWAYKKFQKNKSKKQSYKFYYNGSCKYIKTIEHLTWITERYDISNHDLSRIAKCADGNKDVINMTIKLGLDIKGIKHNILGDICELNDLDYLKDMCKLCNVGQNDASIMLWNLIVYKEHKVDSTNKMVMWLLTEYGLTKKQIIELLENVKTLEYAKIFIRMIEDELDFLVYKEFTWEIHHTNHEITKYYHELGLVDDETMKKIFLDRCKHGNLRDVVLIMEDFNIDVRSLAKEILKVTTNCSCRKHHKEMCGDVYINECKEKCFNHCRHISIAKMMLPKLID